MAAPTHQDEQDALALPVQRRGRRSWPAGRPPRRPWPSALIEVNSTTKGSATAPVDQDQDQQHRGQGDEQQQPVDAGERGAEVGDQPGRPRQPGSPPVCGDRARPADSRRRRPTERLGDAVLERVGRRFARRGEHISAALPSCDGHAPRPSPTELRRPSPTVLGTQRLVVGHAPAPSASSGRAVGVTSRRRRAGSTTSAGKVLGVDEALALLGGLGGLGRRGQEGRGVVRLDLRQLALRHPADRPMPSHTTRSDAGEHDDGEGGGAGRLDSAC